MRAVVYGLEREYQGKIRVVGLDYDVKEDLRKAQRLNANYHPAMVLLRADGTVLRTVIGYQTNDRVRRTVDSLLSE